MKLTEDKAMIGKFLALDSDARGTSRMTKFVNEMVIPKTTFLKDCNLMLIPGEMQEMKKYTKNIVWCHVPSLYMPDYYEQYFTKEHILKDINIILVQSEFHKNNLSKSYKIPKEKFYVVNNHFNPIEYKQKSKEKITFMYNSQAMRGLDTLIEAFTKIKNKNIELLIHTCDCDGCICPDNISYDSKLALDKDTRIKMLGYTSSEDYIKTLQKAHAYVYPCTFEETAAIGVMEAMSAGAMLVTTDLGALPDTTGGFAKIISDAPITMEEVSDTKKKMIKIFRKEIKRCIRVAKKGKFDPQPQIKYINDRFTEENSIKQWMELDKIIGEMQ
jgi:glycosyltransferase involved in cell wall biosynthesis